MHARLQFGCFLAPHHPVGENPILQFQSDLALVAHLDRLGFDEFWCGAPFVGVGDDRLARAEFRPGAGLPTD